MDYKEINKRLWNDKTNVHFTFEHHCKRTAKNRLFTGQKRESKKLTGLCLVFEYPNIEIRKIMTSAKKRAEVEQFGQATGLQPHIILHAAVHFSLS